jgi:uncharacterized oxidoreductase
MNVTNKTVLVTGGGSGIGLEITKLLSQKGNKVIITGRNESKLQKAAAQLENISYIVADLTSAADVDNLVGKIDNEYGALDILVNNAGDARVQHLGDGPAVYDNAAYEMNTNYLSVVRLNEKLLPLLRQSPEAAIVNVSSVVAFAPGFTLPTYAASKAALHSYTRILRYTLAKTTGIKVFELMPPLVNTELSAVIGGENGIPPLEVAEGLIKGLETDEYELHIGLTANIYQLYLSSPEDALQMLNKGRE